MNAPADSAIGGTFPGNPVACAAALAVLDTIEQEGLVERAQTVGATIRSRMEAWQERFDSIGDVRGLGAMLAIELVRDRETKEPAPELATAVTEAALARGLLLLKAGVHGNCIRVLVPLVIADAELDEAPRRSTSGKTRWRPGVGGVGSQVVLRCGCHRLARSAGVVSMPVTPTTCPDRFILSAPMPFDHLAPGAIGLSRASPRRGPPQSPCRRAHRLQPARGRPAQRASEGAAHRQGSPAGAP